MLIQYEKFIAKLDKKLNNYFQLQSEYVCCRSGCSACCEVGDYPFTQLEMMYLMSGFKSLPDYLKKQVSDNIFSIKQNRFSMHLYYKCPFLIENKCCVYKYRGITCRTYGLAYLLDDKTVKLPECSKEGLCYSKVIKDGILTIEPIAENLNLFDIINSDWTKKYKLDFGPSRSLIDWFP